MGDYYKCPRCGNSDIKKLGYLNGKIYCRACLTFNGQEVKQEKNIVNKKCDYSLTYELSESQKNISKKVLENYINGIDTLIHAVCGAGKTELVYEVISYVISRGGNVGFAIPRKDVVIELYERMKEVFKNNTICAVYGGNNNNLCGDIICLTCHQLYRYNHFFDLLIIDEIDAFPFQNNDVLNAFALRSMRGRLIVLSATPSESVISTFKSKNHSILTLNKRFHNHPLPIPKVLVRVFFLKYFTLVKLLLNFQRQNKQVFVFTPTIELCEEVFRFVSEFVKKGNRVHSKMEDREIIIKDFKNKKYDYLITTSVLERGVTVKDLQVIVFFADHKIYTSEMLIQISGRAGRKKDAPDGEVIFLVNKENEEIKNCIFKINKANNDL